MTKLYLLSLLAACKLLLSIGPPPIPLALEAPLAGPCSKVHHKQNTAPSKRQSEASLET